VKPLIAERDNVQDLRGNNLRVVKVPAWQAMAIVKLKAGNNVDIVAAHEQRTPPGALRKKKKSGLMGSAGFGFHHRSSKSTHDLCVEKGTPRAKSTSVRWVRPGGYRADSGR